MPAVAASSARTVFVDALLGFEEEGVAVDARLLLVEDSDMGSRWLVVLLRNFEGFFFRQPNKPAELELELEPDLAFFLLLRILP
jgi:hypothetical protein